MNKFRRAAEPAIKPKPGRRDQDHRRKRSKRDDRPAAFPVPNKPGPSRHHNGFVGFVVRADGRMDDRRIFKELRVRRRVSRAFAAVVVLKGVDHFFKVERQILDALVTLVTIFLQRLSKNAPDL